MLDKGRHRAQHADIMHWLLELDMFPERAPLLAAAARRAGHRVTPWNDDWWGNGRFAAVTGEPMLLHGSLGNASKIKQLGRWRPGAFCDVDAFQCSTWYPAATRWLLNRRTVFTTVAEACADPAKVFAEFGGAGRLFLRPDSPLKPFSGRVVSLEALTPAALDHGFYYDDLSLPILAAPETKVGREWRFAVVEGAIVTGSEYDPDGRTPRRPAEPGAAWSFAAEIAGALPPPERVYVLDVCETAEGLRLLELNPFSGAALYHCEPNIIVDRVARACAREAAR